MFSQEELIAISKGEKGDTGMTGPQGIGSNLCWGYSIALTTGLTELFWHNGESLPPYWIGLISHRIATAFDGNEAGLFFVEKTDSTFFVHPIKSPTYSPYNILLSSDDGKLKARFRELLGPFPAIFSFLGISYFS